MHVLIDIRKPLRRGVKMQVGAKKEEQWFQIQYKRLPNFCYGCRILGHIFYDCDQEYAKGELDSTGNG